MKIRGASAYIYEKTKDGEILYDIYSRLLKDRIIFLTDEITAEVGSQIAATLFYLDSEDNTDDISLYINSPGGSIESLFTIYDMMQLIKAPVATYCIGEACSAGAVLLAAGSKGKRYALPNSRIMIHSVQVSDMSGTADEIKNEAKVVEDTNRLISETLARHTGQRFEKVRKDCKIDKHMSAQEALEYGIVDRILPATKPIPPLRKRVRKKGAE